MNERAEEAKFAIIVGLTIAVVFKTVEFLSDFITKTLVDMWKDAPEFAIEFVGFLIVLIIFIVITLILILRGRE